MHRINDPRYLVGYWPLNGHTQDVSSHGHHGTWVGTEAYKAFLKNSRQAGDFSTSRVSVGTMDDLRLTTFSYAIWFAFANSPPGGQEGFGYKKSGPFNGGSGWGLYWNNGTTNWVLITSGTFASSQAVVADQSWHHLVVTADGTVAAFYLDGVDITASGGITAIPDNSTDEFKIGVRDVDVTTFSGGLADARLYNVALTNDEVLKLMHAPVPTY